MAITAQEQEIIDYINASGSGIMGRRKEASAYEGLSPEAKAMVDVSKIGGIVGRDAEDTKAIESVKAREIEGPQTGDAGLTTIQRSLGMIKDTPKFSGAGGYTSAQDAGGYIKQLQQTLGVKGPESVKGEILDDATRKLDTAAHRQAVLDASGLAARGLTDSGTAAALESQRGINLAGQKASIGADVAQSEADRMDAYRRELMGAAQQQAGALSQFDLSKAGQDLQYINQQQAQQRAQAGTALASGQAQSDQQYRNIMAQYQSQLDQLQQQNTGDLMTLQQNQAERDKNMALASAGLGLAGSLGSAGIGLAG